MSKYKKILLTFACLVFSFLSAVQVQAQDSVPSTIELKVYQLREDSGASTGTLCTKGSMEYGCTAYSDKEDVPGYSPDDYGYPFNVSEVTLDFETQYLLKSLRESRKFIQLVTYPYV